MHEPRDNASVWYLAPRMLGVAYGIQVTITLVAMVENWMGW